LDISHFGAAHGLLSSRGTEGTTMKKLIQGVAMAMAMMVGVGSAQAIDLRNEDERPHQVKVSSSTMSRDLALGGLTLSLVVCVGECTFEVEGVGTVRARGNDVVTIKDGRVTTTAATREAGR